MKQFIQNIEILNNLIVKNVLKIYLFQVHCSKRHFHVDKPANGGRAGCGVCAACQEEVHQEGGQVGPPPERRVSERETES